MSMSPSSILAKLDELKKWQDKQQERLLQQHHKQLEPKSNLNVSEPVIKTTKNIDYKEPNNNAPSKRPYLRRGTGLVRFRMGPGEQFKPFTNANRTPKQNSLSNANSTQSLTPLKTPDLKVLPKAVWETPQAPPPPLIDETDRELIIFEALEQRAMQNSFCSTNSSIVRLLSSTPQKNSPKKDQNARVQAIYAQRTAAGNDLMQVYAQYNQNNAHDVLIEEEARELQEINEYEKVIENNYLNLIQKALQFKQYVDKQEITRCSSSSSLTDEGDSTLHVDTYNDKSKWTDVEIATSESSSSSLSCISEHQSTTCTIGTMTDLLLPADVATQNELKTEVKSVRNESAKVKKLKEQMEQQIKEFERYKKEIYKQVDEEKARVNVTLEEERKKLAKEKMVFERYVKDLQNKPTKREREEISTLKTEIATLKETLKLKESKHGTTQARLRNQIKSLEKDNANLKNEIDNLHQQHAKTLVNQKLNRKPSNTKILHDINKSLSKLTSEQIKKKETSEDELKENNRNVSNTIFASEDTMKEKHDRVELILSDGSSQIKYSNGNVKTTSSDGNMIRFQFFNGDIKETNLLEGTVCYHYQQNKVYHTTNADGTEIIQFPDGQIERRLKDGLCEIDYADGMKRKIHANGREETFLPDGTIVNINEDERVITLPNGQKEIHTSEHKRREYPDGTVKTLYPDGVQETKYASGRIRIKDKYGKLIMDSQN